MMSIAQYCRVEKIGLEKIHIKMVEISSVLKDATLETYATHGFTVFYISLPFTQTICALLGGINKKLHQKQSLLIITSRLLLAKNGSNSMVQ